MPELETNARKLEFSLDGGVKSSLWEETLQVEVPETGGAWSLGSAKGAELSRWHLHGLGIFTDTVPFADGAYSATYIYSEGGGVKDVTFIEGTLAAYTSTILDVDAIIASIAPDLDGISFDKSYMAGTYYGESEPPPTPRFWTGFVNTVETV